MIKIGVVGTGSIGRNLALVKLLKEKGLKVYVHDDLYTRDEIERMNLSYATPDIVDVVFNPFTLELTNQEIHYKGK